MASFLIFIPTFERPDKLQRVLNLINKNKDKHDVQISIIDDGSRKDYRSIRAYVASRDWVRYHRIKDHRGKARFWQIYQAFFNEAKKRKLDYYLFIQDDVTDFASNFFDRLIANWEAIKDHRLIALNYAPDHRILSRGWTKAVPKKVFHNRRRFYYTGWVDGFFICKRECLEALEFKMNAVSGKRWARNSKLSSGVGLQISNRLATQKYHMYCTYYSLIRHFQGVSLMNPLARRRRPIVERDFIGNGDELK